MNALIHRDRHAVSIWLVACLLLIACMVAVGGYTRLSGSGLSITSWKPIHGVVPPLNEMQWQEEFDAYRASPQYEKINKGMSLEEFKVIFWPEYWHRVLGRLIGFVFLIPLVIFAFRRSISRRFFWRLVGIFALGGLQGLIGWIMVASGLKDHPYVNHTKLALHLSMAFAVFGLLVWALLGARNEGRGAKNIRPSPLAPYLAFFFLLCLQIILGALVAGLHAGLVYNTWPDMDGCLVAPDLLAVTPWWENPILIQFLHRTTAILVVFSFIFWWFLCRAYVKSNGLGKVCAGVALALGLQFALGVLTLVNIVPLPLALSHQLVALVLFGMSVILLYGLSSLRGT